MPSIHAAPHAKVGKSGQLNAELVASAEVSSLGDLPLVNEGIMGLSWLSGSYHSTTCR